MPKKSESYQSVEEPSEPERSTNDPEYYIPMREAEELARKAGQLREHAEAIARHNGELFDLVDLMAGGPNGSWQGKRANRFVNEWRGVNNDVSRWVSNIINKAEDLLQEAAALRRRAEDYLAGG